MLVKEGIAGKAPLKETDPAVFQKALDFLYTGTYDDGDYDEAAATLTPTTSMTSTNQGTGLFTGMMQQDINNILETASTELVSLQDSEDGLSDLSICERHPLLLNVQLYHLSELLQVESLKQEAFRRCTELLEGWFNAASFIPAIREALSHVNVRNSELGAQIVKSCVMNLPVVAEHTALDDLLMEFEPIAWTLLKEQQIKYEQDLEEQQAKYEQDQEEQKRKDSGLQEQAYLLKQQNKSLNGAISEWKQRIEIVERELFGNESCRNCGKDYGPYLMLEAAIAFLVYPIQEE